MIDKPKLSNETKQQAEEAQRTLDFVRRVVVRNVDEAQLAVDITKQIKAKASEIEALRSRWVKPLTDVIADIDTHFKPALEALDAAEKQIKILLSEYVLSRQESVNRTLAQVEEAVARGDAQTATALTARARDLAPGDLKGAQIRELWEVEITDATQVPREYWTIDTKILGALAREQKEAFSVPGARATRKLSVAIYQDKKGK